MSDIVVKIVDRELRSLGFRKSGRRSYEKELFETIVSVEIQASRFDSMKHFLNVEVTMSDAVRSRYGFVSRFAAWTRAESINQSNKEEYQSCLDASENLDAGKREACLQKLFKGQLQEFLDQCGTVQGMVEMISSGWGEYANVSSELKALANKAS